MHQNKSNSSESRKGPGRGERWEGDKKELGAESLKCTPTPTHTHTHMKLSKNKMIVKIRILRILHR